MGDKRSTDSDSVSSKRYSFLYLQDEKMDWSGKCPVVYSDKYNISCFGIEKLHPFDSQKWGRVFRILTENGVLNARSVVEPKEVRRQDLLLVHTKEYLKSLNHRYQLASILEVGVVVLFPTCLVDSRVLRPMRYQVGGTILAAKLALEHGWALNIGGGFHHASRHRGGGFCVYADISLAIKLLRQCGLIERAMIVDVDAHQGNGHERDFAADQKVYILDLFNANIYPGDDEAKKAISRSVPLNSGMGDSEYLSLLTSELDSAFRDFSSPNIIVYVAGTDSLQGDQLGRLKITPKGITRRDEHVFRVARKRKVPIVMVTSGGYTQQSAQAIADSILNLNQKGLIQLR